MMIELGYMAKRIAACPDCLDVPHVRDVYAVANCVSNDFCDDIEVGQHNGFWFFDSPSLIRDIATTNDIDLTDTVLVYYRGYGTQFDAELGKWTAYAAVPGFPTEVLPPHLETFLGYDVVTYSMQNAPECSPLSCNGVAQDVRVNQHCLLDTLRFAMHHLEHGTFNDAEPGPYRIVAVSVVSWPRAGSV